MLTLLYLLGGLFGVVSVGVGLAAYRARREAYTNYEKIKWVLEQLERALKQIESDDEDEVIAGLQVIAMLKDPVIRVRALSRLNELTRSDNQNIRHYAGVAYTKLISSSEESPMSRPGEDDE
jgi:biopolymer transport protein ExbB/TolQ